MGDRGGVVETTPAEGGVKKQRVYRSGRPRSRRREANALAAEDPRRLASDASYASFTPLVRRGDCRLEQPRSTWHRLSLGSDFRLCSIVQEETPRCLQATLWLAELESPKCILDNL